MIAAILGTLKAGAAYVPLDPGAPAERLRIDPGRHAAAACSLTQRSLRDRLPDVGAAVLCIDDPVGDRRRATTPRGRRRAACGATTWPTSCTRRDPRGGPRG